MILKDTVVPSERPHPHANAVRGRPWNVLKQELQRRVNSRLTAYLNAPDSGYQPITIGNIDGYTDRLVAGDVILIAGHSRFATLIKYLTQSPWSHVVLFAGMIDGAPLLIEADIESGVRSVSFESLRPFHVRVGIWAIRAGRGRSARARNHARHRTPLTAVE